MPVSATVVLIHSPLVGPMTWRAVAAELEASGRSTAVPSHAGATTVDAIARAVAGQVRPGGRFVLVGHSGAGPLLPAIAREVGRSSTVEACVFVDGRLPRPGRSWLEEAPADLVEHMRSLAGDDHAAPPWHEWFGDHSLAELLPDPDVRAAFEAEVPRLPWSYFAEPGPHATFTGPHGYVLLSDVYRTELERYRNSGAPVATYLSDHLAMVTQPAAVAQALTDVLDRLAVDRWASARHQRLTFGEVARQYDEIRPGYPTALVERVLEYAGSTLDSVVEVGAGTGKATVSFVDRVRSLTSIEPDANMASVLRERTNATVVNGRFEDWTPPARGVGLLLFPQSWHWIDPALRCSLAYRSLRPGGALAVFGNTYAFADADEEDDVHRVYAEVAPEQLNVHERLGFAAAFQEEVVAESALFADVSGERFLTDLHFPTERYIRLLETFSNHRMLEPERRAALHRGIAETIDARGGAITVRVDTHLVLARSVAGARGPRAW